MYTGLIEEIGTIAEVKKSDNSLKIKVNCHKILDGLKIGDSVGINGACQTIVTLFNEGFEVFASSETLKVTTFNDFKAGGKVNIERTMHLSDRLDGHLVSGHVDGIAKVLSIQKTGETTIFKFETTAELSKQIVKKGSVTIDGISLTVAEIEGNIFKTAIIPHTIQKTTLKTLEIADKVNIETDMIAKYVEKYLLPNDNSSRIDTNLLERNGFL